MFTINNVDGVRIILVYDSKLIIKSDVHPNMFAVNNEDDVRIKFSDFLKMPDLHQQSTTCPDGGEVEFRAAGDHRGGASSS